MGDYDASYSRLVAVIHAMPNDKLTDPNAIDSDGTRVAMLRLGPDGPPVLVTDHLPDDRPVLIYRVASLAAVSQVLVTRGWTNDRTLELPMGPATTFRAPGGLRLAIYEAPRPFVIDSMAGRRDF